MENRLTGVSVDGSGAASFVYDGEGNRIKGTVNVTTTLYMGAWFEWSGGAGTSYYYFGGQWVALRAGGQTSYIHGDHLTSATNTTGSQARGPQRYYPYGETRGDTTVETPYRYTGQREEEGIGLYFYNARWYDPALGRFIQPDTIVPKLGNAQAMNRYTYVYNNPLKYTDPTGQLGDPDRDRTTPDGHVIHTDKPFSLSHLSSHPGYKAYWLALPENCRWASEFNYEEFIWYWTWGVSEDMETWRQYKQVQRILQQEKLLQHVGRPKLLNAAPFLYVHHKTFGIFRIQIGPDNMILNSSGLTLPGRPWALGEGIFLDEDWSNVPREIRNHEYMHVLQNRQQGMLSFYPEYIRDFLLWGPDLLYKKNHNEVVAIIIYNIYVLAPKLPDIYYFPTP